MYNSLPTYIKEVSINTKKFASLKNVPIWESILYIGWILYISLYVMVWTINNKNKKIKIILYCYDNCQILPGCINDTAHCINVLRLWF